MFSSIAWVPRGRLLNNPLRYHPTEADEKAARTLVEEIKAGVATNEPEEYSDQLDGEQPEEQPEDLQKEQHTSHEHAHIPDNIMDDDDEEQRDQFQLVNTDNMLICARSAELGFLDCLVYNGQSDDFFFHHNMLITSVPLCTIYLDFSPLGNGASGNYCAVSTCSTEIEIWDLDTLDAISPVLTLGGFQEIGLKPKKSAPYNHYLKNKRTKQIPLPGSHKDHVLTLSWSPLHRNILASGSADETVKLWDLNSAKCIATFSNIHSGGPVSCVLFNPFRPGLLASTCIGDRKVAVTSVTDPSPVPKILTILKADPEQLDWLTEDLLCCTTEMGELLILNIKEDLQTTIIASIFPLAEYATSIDLSLSKVPLTGLTVHPVIKGLIAVGGPEIPAIALCAYLAGSLTVLHVQPVEFSIFSLAWCIGEDSFSLAVGSSNSTAYILQPFSWSFNTPIQDVFNLRLDVPSRKQHKLTVDDDEKDVEDD